MKLEVERATRSVTIRALSALAFLRDILGIDSGCMSCGPIRSGKLGVVHHCFVYLDKESTVFVVP